MITQQVHGVALSLVGAADLILSVGIAWSLSCFSHATRRMRRHDHRVSVALFLASVIACYFGVSAMMDG
jgi:hypothetical protein